MTYNVGNDTIIKVEICRRGYKWVTITMETAKMTCYIVSFEPHSEESRARINERLKTFPSYCPINKYCWAIKTDIRAVQVRDRLAEVMEKGEMLFVVRSGTEGAWRNAYGEKHSAWLKEHL